jgi:PAS domain S-box-containing protein
MSRTTVGCGIIAILTMHVTLLAFWGGGEIGPRWQHHAAHASIEIAGAIAAVWCARVLLWLEARQSGTRHNTALAAALLGTGIIRAIHAASAAGGHLIWLDSVATLYCGLLYSLVWLNQPWMNERLFTRTVAVGSTLLGASVWMWPDFAIEVPIGGDLAQQAALMNLLGGLLILAASVRLLLSYLKTSREDELYFVIHCLLLGLSSVAIDKLSAWQIPWWEGHLLRLSAFAVGGLYAIRSNPAHQVAQTYEALQEANKRLGTSRAIYKTLFDRSENFIGLLSLTGRILDVNNTALQQGGVKADEALGMFVWDSPWCNQTTEVQDRVRLAVERAAVGADDQFDVSFIAPGGTITHVNVFVKAVRDEQGRPIYIITEGRDVSVGKRREAELDQSLRELDHVCSELASVNSALREKEKQALSASEAKSEFLANMSHEIRTPMTAILGYAELLLHDDELEHSGERRHEAAHAIHRNGDHLLRLINDVLDLSKIEAGKLMIELLPCSPVKIIEEAIELMRVRATAKGVTLDVTYETAVPEFIQSDPTRLRQVLVNLIGNAIKFTEFGSVRTVVRYCDKQSPTLECDIIDTGIGLTPSQLERIFQPFMQADTSTTRRFGGSGLGLAISKRLAEDLGGKIEVVRTELHSGSTFRLSIAVSQQRDAAMVRPDVTVADTPGNAAGSNAPGQSQLAGCRIMFAEDGPDNQRFIAFILRKAGATVTIVDNGQVALDSALAARHAGQPFHVILMDMQMPIMDGYLATASLRRAGYCGYIIALTAHAMQEDREKCLAVGCDDYESKPIQRQQLITKVESYYRRAIDTAMPGLGAPVDCFCTDDGAGVLSRENTSALLN